MFKKFPAPSPRIEVLQNALAWDLSHEYIITNTGLHIRHVEQTVLCDNYVDDPHIETTPYGGVDPCPQCISLVPDYVKWKEPEPHPFHKARWSVEDFAKLLGVSLKINNNRPEVNDTGAAPCGAILESFDPLILHVGHHKGKVQTVHRIGALHEFAHIITSPYGFTSESGCGHYAVQYALGMCFADNKELLASTAEVQGLSCPVYGGLMQARAWALGLLDETRNVNFERLGISP